MPQESKNAANDDEQPTANAIAFSDLAAAMQMDEDLLLERFAAILCKRECSAQG